MGQVLHGCATTTEAVRRAIQHSQESLRALAKRYGINQKTVAKWKKRTSCADLPTGHVAQCVRDTVRDVLDLLVILDSDFALKFNPALNLYLWLDLALSAADGKLLRKQMGSASRLESVREHLELFESDVIQERWPDSRMVTDVDSKE
ncbi:hypothetical protein QOZ94_003904, partial [Xanthobacter agilis]|nr:hypothetical protein [Xanthobacter agilis]